jgi:hypothetical protein
VRSPRYRNSSGIYQPVKSRKSPSAPGVALHRRPPRGHRRRPPPVRWQTGHLYELLQHLAARSRPLAYLGSIRSPASNGSTRLPTHRQESPRQGTEELRCDFPAEHSDHLRTLNPIESVFATVRHRTVRTKGAFVAGDGKLKSAHFGRFLGQVLGRGGLSTWMGSQRNWASLQLAKEGRMYFLATDAAPDQQPQVAAACATTTSSWCSNSSTQPSKPGDD